MVANINSMAYYGETPWHELGVKVKTAMTSADAMEKASLNWNVKRVPLFLQENGGFHRMVEHAAIVRQDTQDILGVVGPGYTPFQNREAFSLFDGIVGEKAAMYHTAGALGKGEKVWLLAKLPGYVRIMGDDITEKYLLLATSHDGSLKLTTMFTPIRVVCQNTLNIALSNSEAKRYATRHTLNIGTRVRNIQDTLGIINAKFGLFEELSQKLAVTQLTSEAVASYFKNSGVVPELKNGEEPSTRAKNILDEVSELFEVGKGAELKSAKGTAWGAFNAVVEYVDYKRGSDANRTDSLLFGSGANIKQTAWNKAVELVHR